MEKMHANLLSADSACTVYIAKPILRSESDIWIRGLVVGTVYILV